MQVLNCFLNVLQSQVITCFLKLFYTYVLNFFLSILRTQVFNCFLSILHTLVFNCLLGILRTQVFNCFLSILHEQVFNCSSTAACEWDEQVDADLYKVRNTYLLFFTEIHIIPGVVIKWAVSRDFCHFFLFHESKPLGPLINRLKWFCLKIHFCEDICEIRLKHCADL